MHHISVLHHVLLPLQTHLAGVAAAGLAAVADIILISNHFGTDEAALYVGMDLACGPDRGSAAGDGPGAGFHRPDGTEAHEVEKCIGALDETVTGRVLQTEVGGERAAPCLGWRGA